MIRATQDKAARTDADGNLFASALKYQRWCQLMLLERAGKPALMIAALSLPSISSRFDS